MSTATTVSRPAARTMLGSHLMRLVCKTAAVIVMARLVTPADHGLFAMAATVTLFLMLFRDAGLGAAGVQARSLNDADIAALSRTLSSIDWGLTLATLGLALPAAAFYGEPQVAWLLVVMAPSFACIGHGGAARIRLQRDMRFDAIGGTETRAALIGTGLMIGAAAAGAGPFSFAGFTLFTEAFMMIRLNLKAGHAPAAPAQSRRLLTLLGPGLQLTVYQVIDYFSRQFDQLLTGWIFGPSAIGYYQRSVQLLGLPVMHALAPIGQVGLATLSRIGRKAENFKTEAAALANLSGHLSLPLAGVCVAAPDAVIAVILGSQWPDAAPILRWLAIGAAAGYLTQPLSSICTAAGRTRALMQVSFITLPLLFLALAIGSRHGPAGLAAGVAVTQMALFLPRVFWSLRGLGGGWYVRAFARPIGLSAIVAGLTAGAAWLVPATGAVGVLVPLGAAVAGYGMCVIAWPGLRSELRDVLHHLPMFGRSRSQ